ncbi:hypothetical protein TNCV_2125911 [Trichonephila clavipes]|nr:hypothetical protein TNCV_2125911 [Trichonephila clavipes]
METQVFVKAVTPKCLGGPPVDRDRLYTHPRSKMSIDRKNKGIEGIRPRDIEKLIDIGAMEKEVTDIYNEKKKKYRENWTGVVGTSTSTFYVTAN